tara:strand:- start:12094 stop:12843 length:750 start_codon:yes stop_codon:yes gene_type:complete
MAKPTSRQTLKDYALRRLGAPVIDINVDDSQMEDALDDALQFFAEYHFDGVEKVYLSHQITSTDQTNKYLDMNAIDSNVISVIKMFNVNTNSINMFDVSYQLALNDFFGTFSTGTLTNYTITKQHLEMLEDILDPEKNVRFSRVTNKLYGDFDWENDVDAGDYLVIEAYSVLDPETYTEIYNDRLLKRYTTALIKRAWGANLSKFEGIQLPGGVQFNGQRILEEAMSEIEKIEEEVQDKYELPPDFMMG